MGPDPGPCYLDLACWERRVKGRAEMSSGHCLVGRKKLKSHCEGAMIVNKCGMLDPVKTVGILVGRKATSPDAF